MLTVSYHKWLGLSKSFCAIFIIRIMFLEISKLLEFLKVWSRFFHFKNSWKKESGFKKIIVCFKDRNISHAFSKVSRAPFIFFFKKTFSVFVKQATVLKRLEAHFLLWGASYYFWYCKTTICCSGFHFFYKKYLKAWLNIILFSLR